jgi:chromate transporter
MLVSNPRPLRLPGGPNLLWPGVAGASAFPRHLAGLGLEASQQSGSLATLFVVFLKIGAVSFGSGYVLLAFLRPDVVLHLHWLSDRQLVDAVSIGQVTPGPVFSSAAFVGYLVAGLPGAVVATVAIFLPAFVFVPLVRRILPWARRSPWAGSFLKGATVSALGLMAGVTVQLGRAVIVDLFTTTLAVASFVLLRMKRPGVNAVWQILAGGLLGLLVRGA